MASEEKGNPAGPFLGRVWPAESDAAGVQATDCDAANGILLLHVSVAAPTSFHYGRKKKRAEQILFEECEAFPAGCNAGVQNNLTDLRFV